MHPCVQSHAAIFQAVLIAKYVLNELTRSKTQGKL